MCLPTATQIWRLTLARVGRSWSQQLALQTLPGRTLGQRAHRGGRPDARAIGRASAIGHALGGRSVRARVLPWTTVGRRRQPAPAGLPADFGLYRRTLASGLMRIESQTTYGC